MKETQCKLSTHSYLPKEKKVQIQILVTATAFDHRAGACCHNIKRLGLQSTLTSEVPRYEAPSNSLENPTNPSLSI